MALPLIEDHFPPDFRALHGLPELRDAYASIHAPADEPAIAAATRRLAFDELFLLQLGMAIKRLHRLRDRPAPALPCTPTIDAKVRARIPFQLTPAQNRVIAEITADLAKPQPASRLIQGDVGSGKTVVALYAMLLAVAARRSAALMAPTEILAEQHHRTISAWLKGSSVRVGLLHASLPRAQIRDVRQRLAGGQIDLVIGTHSLIVARTAMPNLALAVIDEQHRFGVHQRAALRAITDGVPTTPHVLVMTATPIPRTLALTLFGDLDVSTIDALPPGRTPITTRVVPASQRTQVYGFVRARLEKGHRAFVVVPAIDAQPTTHFRDTSGAGHTAVGPTPPAEAAKPRSVHELAQELTDGPLAGVRVGVMHGRLPPAERQAAMDDFRSGRTRVLVATTVIEVGVDVPEASVIVIEDADRFGLAQLHQLRGRVGRGSLPSVCVLISPENDALSNDRLLTLAQTRDGFRVAEKDLELRGFGDFFGEKQSGSSHFRVVSFPRDGDLLQLARRAAQHWADQSPSLDQPRDALLRKRLLKLYGEWVRLGDIA
ncbi:MAG: DNA helicase RecG [Planctomyces sp.]|nr:DNA helicase RecG [Planctomyces sp.]